MMLVMTMIKMIMMTTSIIICEIYDNDGKNGDDDEDNVEDE